jgi:hypothetical protein
MALRESHLKNWWRRLCDAEADEVLRGGIRKVEDMQKEGGSSECEILEKAAGGIDAVCRNASDFQGGIVVQGPFSMLKFRKGPRSVEETMTEHTVMMDNVIAWLIGLTVISAVREFRHSDCCRH